MDEIGMTFRASCFAVVRRWRTPGTEYLPRDVLAGRRFRQVGRELDNANGEVNQSFFEFVGPGLRTLVGCFIFHICPRFLLFIDRAVPSTTNVKWQMPNRKAQFRQ